MHLLFPRTGTVLEILIKQEVGNILIQSVLSLSLIQFIFKILKAQL